MILYPILFTPIIKTMIWGQESWDVSCRPLEMGVIENGEYAGMGFDAYIALNHALVLGAGASERFPLLVKIITARDTLSVQVHPGDEYARRAGGFDTGKSEMWYVIEPPTDGNLVIGLKDGVTRENFPTLTPQKAT